MRQYFIETSTIINFLREKKGAVKTIRDLKGELVSSFVCLAELYEGVYRAEDKKQAEQDVQTFFSGLSEVFGLDQQIAKEFGRIRTELKRKGEVIEDLDIIVGATCLAHGCTLVTYNTEHFKRIEGLEILPLPTK